MFTRPLTPILLTAFAFSLVWAVLVPLWQFPDEQAHFGEVQNIAEQGRVPSTRLDLSREIYESERVMGTLRDELGNNKYTYHPEYRLAYGMNYTGPQEETIAAQPLSSRTDYVRAESPRYPPLYYWYTALAYRLVYFGSLFTRVFMARFFTVLLFVMTVYAAYLFARNLFTGNQTLILSTTIAVALHPMLMFVGSGVNNDILIDLIGTLLLWRLVLLVKQPLHLKTIIWLIALSALGLMSKQLIYLFFPGIGIILILKLVFSKNAQLYLYAFISTVLLVALVWLLTRFDQGFWHGFWPAIPADKATQSIIISQITGHLSQLYRETLPWYWGVYKWLGVVLPLWLLRLIKALMVVGVLGYLKPLLLHQKYPPGSPALKVWLTLIWVNLVYVVVLVAWDIALTLKLGFGHGLQGRYFFPLIASHMAFLVYGWYLWFTPTRKRFFLPVLTLAFVALNLFSLHRVMDNYYQLRPLWIFLREASQYKPAFAKWPFVSGYFLFAFLSLVWLLYLHFRSAIKPNKIHQIKSEP